MYSSNQVSKKKREKVSIFDFKLSKLEVPPIQGTINQRLDENKSNAKNLKNCNIHFEARERKKERCKERERERERVRERKFFLLKFF